MRELLCEVHDENRFSRELIIEFINKTPGISIVHGSKHSADIIFFDADLNTDNWYARKVDAQLIVVSANNDHMLSLFKNQITDFLYKPNLSYTRFKTAIERVRQKISLSNSNQV